MIPEQLDILRKLAEDKKYGRGSGHALQVKKLALRIYDGLAIAGWLNGTEDDKMILEAAALLHDIGLPRAPHNEVAFDFLADKVPGLLATHPLPDDDLATLLYCVLWHRDEVFENRGNVGVPNPVYTKKMSAIIRVADALDRTLWQLVEDISLEKG